MNIPFREGYLPLHEGLIWYRLAGPPRGVPLLILHGGPGIPHDYLKPLEQLADERPVVFYDQLGCGRSDRPDAPSLWTVERYTQELKTLRELLGLYRFHLFGHSWGSILAAEYAFTRPEGLLSLIFAGPAFSIPRVIQDAERLKAGLPDPVRSALDAQIRQGATDSLEFRQAVYEYQHHHICRIRPFPKPYQQASGGMGVQVLETMLGLSIFTVAGNLKTYDCVSRLPELRVPVLLTCGRYDQSTPETAAEYQSRIPASRLVVFENSSHMPHLEEPESYLRIIRDFLREVENQR
ncbi:MAG TPA: proline iminopeptidase-family hydrolase [bacterium]|nr:proline iminopeptidase-family hydrolase [bacterium]